MRIPDRDRQRVDSRQFGVTGRFCGIGQCRGMASFDRGIVHLAY